MSNPLITVLELMRDHLHGEDDVAVIAAAERAIDEVRNAEVTKFVDNSIDLDDRFKNVWTKEDLQSVLFLAGQIIYKKTDEYGFSYCQAGMSSCVENVRRKYHRFMKQTNGIPSDLNQKTLFDALDDDYVEEYDWPQMIADLLESLLDLGNYAYLTMLYVKHQCNAEFSVFEKKNREYCQPIAKELGYYIPTEAELNGYMATDRKEKRK